MSHFQNSPYFDVFNLVGASRGMVRIILASYQYSAYLSMRFKETKLKQLENLETEWKPNTCDMLLRLPYSY